MNFEFSILQKKKRLRGGRERERDEFNTMNFSTLVLNNHTSKGYGHIQIRKMKFARNKYAMGGVKNKTKKHLQHSSQSNSR